MRWYKHRQRYQKSTKIRQSNRKSVAYKRFKRAPSRDNKINIWILTKRAHKQELPRLYTAICDVHKQTFIKLLSVIFLCCSSLVLHLAFLETCTILRAVVRETLICAHSSNFIEMGWRVFILLDFWSGCHTLKAVLLFSQHFLKLATAIMIVIIPGYDCYWYFLFLSFSKMLNYLNPLEWCF